MTNIPMISGVISFVTMTAETLFGPKMYYISGQHQFLSEHWILDVEKEFAAHKRRFPDDTLLYRTFPKHPWQFWRWAEYALWEPWQVPYRAVPKAVLDSLAEARMPAALKEAGGSR